MAISEQASILAAETALRQAMLDSDVAVLDELLADTLIFTNHQGQRLGKKDDLLAHSTGLLHISALTVAEQDIVIHHDTALVFAKITLQGQYDGAPANGTFRFTRVWQYSSEHKWQVVAAHSSMVNG